MKSNSSSSSSSSASANLNPNSNITLNHGAGGRQMQKFINKIIVDKLKNGILERLDDCAVLALENKKRIAMTTDSYVVSPIFFDGGDIGKLAVCGTVNDLSTSGAKPLALSLAFILEEGISLDTIEKIVSSIATTALEAGIKIVTGDTKVVERGKCDQIYINTCGIGLIDDDIHISSYNAKKDDLVFITGPIGNHEIAMLKARKLLDFNFSTISDVAPLNTKVQTLLNKTKKINVIKDPTRGGLASALNEIAEHSNCEIYLFENQIPVDLDVQAVCEIVGLDPLYLANEGKLIIIADPSAKDAIYEIFKDAKHIGHIKNLHHDIIKNTNNKKCGVYLETTSAGIRKIGVLETTQLPRIC
ncbi:MAG: hydrogenase expression/formation protein HypE [Oligoflexia bacterium]|nr:hydrogenase expression/formation protein HypE [Oligoflexia bacterium]